MLGNSKGKNDHVSRILLVIYNTILRFIRFSTQETGILESA